MAAARCRYCQIICVAYFGPAGAEAAMQFETWLALDAGALV